MKRKAKYLEIYEDFRQKIINHVLKKNEKLPSIRRLKDELNVSRNTVALAYDQLLIEGFIRSEEKKGYYVEKIDSYLLKPEPKGVSEPLNDPIKKYIDLNQSAVDEEYFPKDIWRKMVVRAIDQLEIQYGEWKGDHELRKELQRYLYLSRGVNASIDQIVIGAGTNLLLNFICLSLHFKRVGFEEPGYFGARSVFENHKKIIQPISLNESGINIDELEKLNPDILYLTPSHQYPTGVITPMKIRQEIMAWAEKNSAYIIEDDYDSEYRFKGKPIPALQSIDTGERVIYISTFSKAFLPSMRMAYMVIPKHLLDLFDELKTWDQTIPFIDQRGMAHFMKEGYWEKHHRKMRKVYREKHQIVLDSFAEVFEDNVHVITQDTGLRVLLEFRSNFKEIVFIERAKAAGFLVRGTEPCWYKSTDRKNIVSVLFGYGLLKKEEIRGVILELYGCWKSLI